MQKTSPRSKINLVWEHAIADLCAEVRRPNLRGEPESFDDLPRQRKRELAGVGFWLPVETAEEYYEEILFQEWLDRQPLETQKWLSPQRAESVANARDLEAAAQKIKRYAEGVRRSAESGDTRGVRRLMKAAKDDLTRARYKRLVQIVSQSTHTSA